MKKLLTICLLLAISFTSQAQEKKPTKVETLDFMKRTIEQTIGQYAPGKGTIQEIKFNENSYYFSAYYDLIKAKNSGLTTLIKWENLAPEGFYVQEANPITKMKVTFNGNISYKQKVGNSPEKEFFFSEAEFFVPSNKAESFKKACIRLSEIAKEENKDPFAN
ncbi:MAG: hypothetical protein WC389_11365 [Lutibacter sp.]|jgi:hypothetical protein